MENIKIYLLCGKARTGKNTVGRIIKEELENTNHKVCEIQIMRTLKGYIKDYFNWDGNEDTKPRKLLQQLGYDVIREKLGLENFHIDRLTEDIKILSNYFDTFIVSDVRLPHEIEEIKNRFNNTVSINIVKDNYISPLDKEEANHITETALDNYDNFDYKIINNDIEEVRKNIVSILGGK